MSEILSFNDETNVHIDVTINGASPTPTVVNDTATFDFIVPSVATLEVADITDPSSELSVYAGVSQGDLVLCYQPEVDLNDRFTLYAYDPDSRESDEIPYVVAEAGTEGSWIAVGGRYNYWEYLQLTDGRLPIAITVGDSSQLIDSPLEISYVDGEPQMVIHAEVGGASEDYTINISPSFGGNAGSAIVQVSSNQTNNEPYANIEATATAASVKAVYNTTTGPVLNRYALLAANNTEQSLELGYDSDSYFTLKSDSGSGAVALKTPSVAPAAGQFFRQNAANNRTEFVTPDLVIPIGMLGALEQAIQSGSGTLTPTLTAGTSTVAASIDMSVAFTGAQTKTIYLPINFPYYMFGRRVTVTDLKLTMAKTTVSAGTARVDNVAIGYFAGTSNSTTQAFTAIVTDATNRLTGGASATPVTWTTGFADTQQGADGALWLKFDIVASTTSTVVVKLYVGSNHSQVSLNFV